MIEQRRRRRNRDGIWIGLLLLQLAYASVVVARTTSSDSTVKVTSLPEDRSFDDPTRLWRAWQRSLQQAVSDSSNNDTSSSFHLQSLCAVVEQAFSQNVTCKCAGSEIDNFSITCDYRQPLCRGDQNATCGVPQMALAMVHGAIFSATTCLSDYRRGAVALADTCVFVDACVEPATNEGADPDRPLFCGCTASYGGAICQSCHVCDAAGTALSVDCTNVNAEAVSTPCTALDLDLQLSEGAGQFTGFAPPDWAGFCSALEGALENRIACDCTNAVGGSYTVTCRTMEDDAGDAVVVESTAAIVAGAVQSVTACAKDRVTTGTTCTTVVLSDANGTNAIGSCAATYNGEACQSCVLCEGVDVTAEQSIRLDCSNRHAAAVMTECQGIDVASSYEFVPHYFGTSGIALPTSSSAAVVPLLAIGMGIVWGTLLGCA